MIKTKTRFGKHKRKQIYLLEYLQYNRSQGPMDNFVHNKRTSLNVYLKGRQTLYSNTVERDARRT